MENKKDMPSRRRAKSSIISPKTKAKLEFEGKSEAETPNIKSPTPSPQEITKTKLDKQWSTYVTSQAEQENLKNIIEHLYSYVSQSGKALGGTLTLLNDSIENIQEFFVGNLETIENKIKENIGPLWGQVDEIKEALPTLEQTRASLKTIEKFLDDNRSFFISSIAAEGKIRSLEGELSSLSGRLEKVETNKNISWNKTATIFTIGIAILSIIIACISAFTAILVALLK